MDALEEFAWFLVREPGWVRFGGDENMHLCALATWVATQYGYSYAGPTVPLRGRRWAGLLSFVRNEDPRARRVAAWMRDPWSDPELPPPVNWHTNGGIGFHPPGWHPDARAFPTPADLQTVQRTEEALRLEFGVPPNRARRGLAGPPRFTPHQSNWPSRPEDF